jgi:phage-related protein
VRLGARDRAFADRALDRLVSSAESLRMPHSRALGAGLHELRFTCEGVQRRVTYAFGSGREVNVLTTFRKQRDRERHEVDRAHRALGRSKARERDLERSR